MALLQAAVIAAGASLIGQYQESRRRRPALVPDEPAPVSPPRRPPAPAALAPARAPAPPPAEPARGTLRLRVTGPHGLRLREVEAYAVRRGDPDETENGFDEPDDEDRASGRFVATDLDPGLYDVVVEAPGMRAARVAGVATDGPPVAVALERAPVLRGALGRGAPGACEGAEVQVFGPDDALEDAEAGSSVDGDTCRFELEDLPETGPLTVVARRAGRTERALVTLPDTGEPPFLCLAGPCDPPAAWLAIYVADASGLQVEMAELEVASGGAGGGEMTLTTLPGFGLLQGHAARELRLTATALDRTARATVFASAGVTDVLLTLPAEPAGQPNDEPEDEMTVVVR
jgi:hypothetical protein